MSLSLSSRSIWLLALALAALACMCSSAFAADASQPLAPQTGFSVSPLSLTDIRLAPGQSITGTLQVFTYGGGRSFEVTVGQATQGSDGAYILQRQSKNPEDVSNWLTANPAEFTSGPGDVEPITWTVQIPSAAAPGDYVGLIFIKRIAPDSNTANRVNLEYAVRAEITVLGEQKFNPVIEQLNSPSFSNGTDFSTSMKLVNRGNVRLDLDNADARLEYIVAGKVRKRFRLEGVIYPNVSRVWNFKWDHPPRFAHATTRVVIAFPKSGDRPATTVKREAGTWILPYREIIFAIAILGVLLMLLLAYLSRRRRERLAQEAAMASAGEMAGVVVAPIADTDTPDEESMRVVRPDEAQADDADDDNEDDDEDDDNEDDDDEDDDDPYP